MNKTRILTWAIVLLVALNLSIVATMVYQNYQVKRGQQTIVTDTEGKCSLSGHYFRDSLHFDSKQMQVYRESNRSFRQKANRIISQIDSIKTIMFVELKKQQPDTMKLNGWSDEIGMLHAGLKKETNRFYLTIRKVCNDQQFSKMQGVFSPLFCKENCHTQGGHCKMNATNGERKHGEGFTNHKIHH